MHVVNHNSSRPRTHTARRAQSSPHVALLGWLIALLTLAQGCAVGPTSTGWPRDDDAAIDDDASASPEDSLAPPSDRPLATADAAPPRDVSGTPACPAARDCRGVSCGVDPVCGVSCGTCADGLTCDRGRCVMPTPVCPRDAACTGRACGADPVCGTSCGTCAGGQPCVNGQCMNTGPTCPRDAACSGRECGPDPVCGASCGMCRPNYACSAAGRCVCVPHCDGRTCGDDGCGGSCGMCRAPYTCNDGHCTCVPHCDGRTCGPDGCGGLCGTCPGGTTCSAAGRCECSSVRFNFTSAGGTWPLNDAALCGFNTQAFSAMFVCEGEDCDVSTYGSTLSYDVPRGETHDLDIYCCLFDGLSCTRSLYDRSCRIGGSLGTVPCTCNSHRVHIAANVCVATTIAGCTR